MTKQQKAEIYHKSGTCKFVLTLSKIQAIVYDFELFSLHLHPF